MTDRMLFHTALASAFISVGLVQYHFGNMENVISFIAGVVTMFFFAAAVDEVSIE